MFMLMLVFIQRRTEGIIGTKSAVTVVVRLAITWPGLERSYRMWYPIQGLACFFTGVIADATGTGVGEADSAIGSRGALHR